MTPPGKRPAQMRAEQSKSARALQTFLKEHPQVSADFHSGQDIRGKSAGHNTAFGLARWAEDALLDEVLERLENRGMTKSLSGSDWADAELARQLDGMGVSKFQVAVQAPDGRFSLETADVHGVLEMAANLRRQNANGANVHVRAKEDAGYSVSVVDDLIDEAIQRMKAGGFTPAVVVRTSPNNYQAWMRHGEALTKEEASAAGKLLAERFGGDPGAAPAGHMGRLAGTTNRKEKHRTEEGKFPWVTVTESKGQVYEAAPEFVAVVRRQLVVDKNRRYEAEMKLAAAATRESRADQKVAKTIDDFRADHRYGGDLHRADFAYAKYALGGGRASRADVAAAIRTRDLSHKAKSYVEDTVRRAEDAVAADRTRLSPESSRRFPAYGTSVGGSARG